MKRDYSTKEERSDMKSIIKVIVICVSVVMILNVASYSYAQSMSSKLQRGLINILTGWFEIPNNMGDAVSKKDFASALLYGLPKGCFMTVLRTAAGAYDTATFILPLPEHYKPIMEPEFAFNR